ncbi:MAG TPA: PEP-CTERM sorting domain-containing protein [Lacipirellulaceae bacterium]|jgi:hypothetical protein|nr:PEP-CTERM sorting domain-containing protein [Lacipirellulaceae bacterium]
MTGKLVLSAIVASLFVSTTTAAPVLSVIPQGLQGGNWVWEVDITPDLAIAGGFTPLATELGFRLSGDPLVSVTSASPLVFDTNLAGNVIFGWEIPYGSPPYPEGVEANCAACSVTNLATFAGHAATVVPGTTNEIFSALGSINVAVPGAIPYLKIVAQGPGTGGPSSSTIQWLGAYSGQGHISQEVGGNPQDFSFSGSLTQSVPEPASLTLISGAALGLLATGRRRRSAQN